MQNIRLIVVGAHPDDCDIKTGGIALKTLKNGGQVMFVSATNGNAGHHELNREDLRVRRLNETKNVSKQFGIQYIVMDNDDGYLQNTIKNRDALIEIIRTFKPDIIATHRPYDYHTDHRNASMLVQDASFLLRVPLVCPNTAALDYDPVILYLSDGFNKPVKFKPDIVVDIQDVNDEKVRMVHCHQSQIYEWLPWLSGNLDRVPKDELGRIEFTNEWMNRRYKGLINPEIIQLHTEIYKGRQPDQIKYVEAFEVCEYGRSVTRDELMKLLNI